MFLLKTSLMNWMKKDKLWIVKVLLEFACVMNVFANVYDDR